MISENLKEIVASGVDFKERKEKSYEQSEIK
jgi:hypothetical protein